MPSTALSKKKPTGSAKVSNGSLLLHGVDGRSQIYRRYRDLCGDLATQAFGGDPTQAQMQLIRRAASISAWCEAEEAKMAQGLDVDMTEYGSLSNTLRRLLADIGLTKKTAAPRDITSWLANREASK